MRGMRTIITTGPVCLAAVVAVIFVPLPVRVMSQGQFLEANGARLYYEADGQGPPLVLIHGWSLLSVQHQSRESWRFLEAGTH